MQRVHGSRLDLRRAVTNRFTSLVAASTVALLALSSCAGRIERPAPEPGAEVVVGQGAPLTAEQAARARWSSVISLPLVPSSAAVLSNGRVLLWSAEDRFNFNTGRGHTHTAMFDPQTQQVSSRDVQETGHDMFCTGTSVLADGRILINGGIDSSNTTLYEPVSNSWTRAAAMNLPRGYNANTALADGSVLTIGGSWSQSSRPQFPEVWSAQGGWRLLRNVAMTSTYLYSPAGSWDSDSHYWVFAAGNGKVFHAGPGTTMHWITTEGDGSITAVGKRGDDAASLTGNAVMYDVGKILKAGGVPRLTDSGPASAASYLIDINHGVSVRKTAPMAYPRVYASGVVLPNGQVVILGGQTTDNQFRDVNAVLAPEIFDPATETFMRLPAASVARVYHSVGLLLPDARVVSAGGGLCGSCTANHPDMQILSPPYLFNSDGSAATRPRITRAPAEALLGETITVNTDAAVTAFSLVRMSAITHTVNADQRRVPVEFQRQSDTSYALQLSSNPGVLLPGPYMLFAMNAQGTPSVAAIVSVRADGLPALRNPDTQLAAVGSAIQLSVSGVDPDGDALQFSASGMPPGVEFDAGAQRFTGRATRPGDYTVTLSASNGAGTISTEFQWQVAETLSARYVRLEALSEIGGRPYSAAAELNLLGAERQTLSRSGFRVSADSEELNNSSLPGAASNALDGNASSFWHSSSSGTPAPLPHTITIDMGVIAEVSGLRMLPRQGTTSSTESGIIGRFRIYTSLDGRSWGSPVASGDFSTLGALRAEKTVYFDLPPVVSALPARSLGLGQRTSVQVQASDPNAQTLTYSATGLPPGLSIDEGSGTISGTATAAGSYDVSVRVTNSQGLSATTGFTWEVAVPDVAAHANPPVVRGGTVEYAPTVRGVSDASFVWEFGDGTRSDASSSVQTTHTYAAPGIYTVTLSIVLADGTTTTRSFLQAVYAEPTSVAPHGASDLALRNGETGQEIWVVNHDNDSVSVFDASTYQKLAEINVGAAPRSLAVAPGGQVWVANKRSSTISVIDAQARSLTRIISLPRACQPHALLFSPVTLHAFVTLEACGELLELGGDGTTLRRLAVGENPRHLAISGDGETLLIARYITPPLPGESSAKVRTTDASGAPVGGEVLAVDTESLAIASTVVLRVSDIPDQPTAGRGVPNYLGALAIAPDGRSAFVPSKQDNIQRGQLRDQRDLTFETTVRAISSRIDLGTLREDYAARIDHDDASVASAAVFHPTGAYLFVSLETSREVAVVDPVTQIELLRVPVGRAPQGLAVSDDGRTLYVSNFMDRSVSVLDLSPLQTLGQLQVPLRATLQAVASEKLPAAVLLGKQLFYDAADPRLARDSYLSCATCHNDGGHDGRVWDLTHAGEGLRNTISLRGRAGGQGLLHWSGNFDEVQDFEGQIRTLAAGDGLMSARHFNTGTRSQPLGLPKAGLSSDLDALAAYVGSLGRFDASPRRAAEGSLSAEAQTGRALFVEHGCASCHGGAQFTLSAGADALRDVGTRRDHSGKRLGGELPGFDIPTLRDCWATAPYLHDGSAPTLREAVAAHRDVAMSDAELDAVAAFVAQIGREERGLLPSGEAVEEPTSDCSDDALTACNPAVVLPGTGGTAEGGGAATPDGLGAGPDAASPQAVGAKKSGGGCSVQTNSSGDGATLVLLGVLLGFAISRRRRAMP